MEARFIHLNVLLVFYNLVHFFDTPMGPTKNIAMFGEKEIIELSQHLEVLLLNGNYNTIKILEEWEIFPSTNLQDNLKFGNVYLQITK